MITSVAWAGDDVLSTSDDRRVTRWRVNGDALEKVWTAAGHAARCWCAVAVDAYARAKALKAGTPPQPEAPAAIALAAKSPRPDANGAVHKENADNAPRVPAGVATPGARALAADSSAAASAAAAAAAPATLPPAAAAHGNSYLTCSTTQRSREGNAGGGGGAASSVFSEWASGSAAAGSA